MDSIATVSHNVIDFAVGNGMLIKSSSQEYTNIPFTFFPSPISEKCYLEVKSLQPHVNELVYLISQDTQFLLSSLKSVVATDGFTKHLVEIFEETLPSDIKSTFDLGILRSDYMLDYNPESQSYLPKQIEVNTIASSFGGLGGNLCKSVHVKSLKEANRTKDIAFLPDNPSANEIGRGLVEGWNSYKNPKAIIVFLVYHNEVNVFDQRTLENAIYSINDQIVVRRKSFEDVIKHAKISSNGSLFIQDEEVALIYFRAGYKPDDYTTSQHWNARRLMEKSRAIKCPSVALQLAGSKKIQQVLARPGTVEKFVKDPAVAKRIRATFAGLYSLDLTPEGNEAVKMALAHPENFVMKPQREGGGNNVYGQDIARLLKEIGSNEERSGYILMERVRPQHHANYTVVRGQVSQVDVVNELGIFGVFLATKEKLLFNYTAGHLLRSKPKDLDEGGVAVGVAMLDSPLLV